MSQHDEAFPGNYGSFHNNTPRKKSKKKKLKRKPFPRQYVSQPPFDHHDRDAFQGNQSKFSFPTVAMTSWAENFTLAATWQLKRQIAYWRARAIALQKENKLLHSIIKQNHYVGASGSKFSNSNDNYSAPSESSNSEKTKNSDTDSNEEEEEEFEVSEEFLEFLKKNAKYKQEMKSESERIERETKIEVEPELTPTQIMENKLATMKNLYGDKWEKISALVTSMDAQWMNEVDKMQPTYWPNIPLNFNFK